MTYFFRTLVVLAAGLALLLADTTWAALAPTPPGPEITKDVGMQLARRRKRRRRKKRKPPKPTPAPAPEPAPAIEPAAGGGGGGAGLSRTSRIEFDAQLIKGQTTKAGEVQILERKDTELKSMVKRRTSFREEIIHTVFPDK